MFSRKKLIFFIFSFFIVFIIGILIGKSGFLSTVKSHLYSIVQIPSEKTHKVSTYRQERKNLFNKLGKRSSDVLLIGDSLIDNGEWHELLPSHVVVNRGIQGITTSGLLDLLPQIKLIESPRVFVMIGINDLRRGIGDKDILYNFSNLINQLRNSFEYIFINSVLFGLPHEKELNKKIMDLNTELEKLSKKNEKIIFINLNTLISPNGHISKKYSYDGIHLNGGGYSIWKDVIKKHIEESP